MLLAGGVTVLIVQFRAGDDRALLHVAAYQGNVERIRVALDLGADVNQAVEGIAHVGIIQQATPLLLAAANADAATTQLLLDRGADVDQAPQYLTLVEAAATAGNIETLEVLINAGASIDAHAITCAIGMPADLAMVDLLLAAGADPNDGTNPGRVAIDNDRDPVLERLLDAGLEVDFELLATAVAGCHQRRAREPGRSRRQRPRPRPGGRDAALLGARYGSVVPRHRPACCWRPASTSTRGTTPAGPPCTARRPRPSRSSCSTTAPIRMR